MICLDFLTEQSLRYIPINVRFNLDRSRYVSRKLLPHAYTAPHARPVPVRHKQWDLCRHECRHHRLNLFNYWPGGRSDVKILLKKYCRPRNRHRVTTDRKKKMTVGDVVTKQTDRHTDRQADRQREIKRQTRTFLGGSVSLSL